ncbi:hypothetical protein NEOLEDRAFT_1237729 [Neolentinus lepideus HHB14362 ss-1]|uniref:SLS1 C-terminal domain-containing protein n=1 Tax=Neolentinus lepideus HHB14362 ss-1 TaxID=1314782 RepID=A0A165W0G7_9AGAM|nr:hypothetical protein NEOLEDRAFT_1237729 [Neolentinus lepideus HHB14362 ss-1]
MSRVLLRRAARARTLCSYAAQIQQTRAYSAPAPNFLSEPPNDAATRETDPVAGPSSVVLDAHEKTAAPSAKKGRPRRSGEKSSRSKKSKKADKKEDVIPQRISRTILDADEDELRLSWMTLPRQTPLTLEDLERYRPQTRPDPEDSKYPHAYNRLVDTLNRAFAKRQLQKFAAMYGLDIPSKFTKLEVMEAIVERQWEWPTLAEVEKQKRDRSEVLAHSFPLTAPQLFHILGKDGADLLQISVEYNVHVSFTSNPLALRVEGLRKSIRGVSARVHELRRRIVTESVALPSRTPIPREMLQGLSREANAFIENDKIEEGRVNIFAKSFDDLKAAKRLVIRNDFSGQASHPRHLLLSLSHRPHELGGTTRFPRSYAMYPSISLQPLPLGVSPTGVFRVRQVGQWLGSSTSDGSDDAGSSGTGSDLVWDVHGDPQELRSVLLGRTVPNIPSTGASTKTVTASIGHLLLTPNTPDRNISLTPPIQGQLPIARILEWVAKSHPKTTFMPSVPPSVMSTILKEQHLTHRLVYRNTRARDALSSEASIALIFEVVMPAPNDVLISPNVTREDDMSDTSKESASYESRVRYGSESFLDLMLPDKRYDLRMSVTDLRDLTEHTWPSVLTEYSNNLRAYLQNTWEWESRPEAPIHFKYKGSDFVLESNTNFSDSRGDVSQIVTHPETTPIVLMESIIDLEGVRKITDCKVQCVDPRSETDWAAFFAVCDRLADGNPVVNRPLSAVFDSEKD